MLTLATLFTLTVSRSYSHLLNTSTRQTVSNTNNQADNSSNSTTSNDNASTSNANNTQSNSGADAGGSAEDNEDPFATTPKIRNSCENSYGKFNPENCKTLADMVVLSAKNRSQQLEVRKAFLILLYFAGLAFMVFAVVTLIRIHAIGVRSMYAIRACWIFGIGLTLVGVFMPIFRALLAPFDAEVLGLNSTNSKTVQGCCSERLGDAWPKTENSNAAPLIRSPFLGEPPRNYWPFWLVVAASFGTAISLAATLIYLRIEETRGVRQGKSVVETLQSATASIYNCAPTSDEHCVHSPQT